MGVSKKVLTDADFVRKLASIRTRFPEAVGWDGNGTPIEEFPERRGQIPLFPGIEVNRVKMPERCVAGRDGDCIHAGCPQNRDNEPEASGRHCPLDLRDEDY